MNVYLRGATFDGRGTVVMKGDRYLSGRSRGSLSAPRGGK